MTATTKADRGSRRRGSGLRALAASLPKVTSKAFGAGGLALSGLIAEWPSIIGAELAAVTLPRKLDKRGEGTLTLRVATAHALAVQHLEPLLLERVNGYLGHRAVTRLRLQQGPIAGAQAKARSEPPPITAEQEAALEARTAKIQDDQLRDALERLGRAVYQDSAAKERP